MNWEEAKAKAVQDGREGDWGYVMGLSGMVKEAAAKESNEELIDRWKKQNDYTAYRKLKEANKGMIMQAVNMYRAASIPTASLEAEAWILFDDAVNGFDNKAGAKFSTYLSYQLRKLDRHTKKYQNIARIPEALSAKIGDYDRSFTHMSQELGRQPTHKEMSKKLGISVKQVKQMNTSRRSDIFESWKPDEGGISSEEKTNWVLIEVRDELSPQEREVYDYLIGYKRKQITNKRELATKMGMSPGRISQITGDISRKVAPFIKKR
jgi:DNA-directed RNA polymerase sigma subunit (sigma70/sigma32)